jgi:hypothetical protein
MVFEKLQLLVGPSPARIKPLSLPFIQIVVVVGHFFWLVASLFSHYFPPLVIEHPLLSDPPNPLVVFVGLLLLRNSLTVGVLACAVLEVALAFDFAVGTHLRGAHEGLADVGPLLAGVVQPSVGI